MTDIGFKTESAFSLSQLGILFVVIAVCLLILFFLKKKKDEIPAWLSSFKKQESIAIVEKQTVDSGLVIYSVKTAEHKYVIAKSNDNLIMLDKVEQSKK
ncbi:hypothetical protein [Agaribacter marinus]|uniref:Flagellar protein n=1 Tax=Agaribacter marinus TaxID=1431249 RepID=A0AA37WHD5_9ALTE|nr:hypothetical protein [Agaribacter marinus]GLR70023.1 hypothetical protein GCM10007852_09310 [Agaribacter marinus]